MKIKNIILFTGLTSCTTVTQPPIPEPQQKINQAVYQDLKTSEARIIRLERRVFAKEIQEQQGKEKNQKK